MSLWSTDSEDSTGGVSKVVRSADYYKRLYQAEVNKRIELEEQVDKQRIEIENLQKEINELKLEKYKANYLFETDNLFDNDEEIALEERNNLQQNEVLDSINLEEKRNSGSVQDARWNELAQAERERKSKAKRNMKRKSLRLPLSAAAQLAQQHRVESSAVSSSSKDPIVKEEPDLASIEISTLEVKDESQQEESATLAPDHAANALHVTEEEKKRIRITRRRNVRHDTNLKRLNVKSLPKDLTSNGIANHRKSADSEVKHASFDTYNHVSNTYDDDGINFDSDNSGWDSGGELFPSQKNGSQSIIPPVSHTVSPAIPTLSDNTNVPNANDLLDEDSIDSVLISWARGKRLVDLLRTINEIAPPNTIPLSAISLQDNNSIADIRKTYLKVVRFCHPDKLVTQTSLAKPEQMLLAKMFTILSDSYKLFSDNS